MFTQVAREFERWDLAAREVFALTVITTCVLRLRAIVPAATRSSWRRRVTQLPEK
jgi:hypothetical protein